MIQIEEVVAELRIIGHRFLSARNSRDVKIALCHSSAATLFPAPAVALVFRTMPERSRRPRDVNELASRLVDEATGAAPKYDPDEGKDPAAVALGRKGGLKGGKARAASMTPEQRKEAAKKAAQARWKRDSDTTSE
jgi:hypothetical protein